LQRFAALPDGGYKRDFIAIVEHRCIELKKSAVPHTRRVCPAQGNSFETALRNEKNTLAGTCSRNAGAERNFARIVEGRKWMPRELGQHTASRHCIADSRRLRNSRGGREENTFAGLRTRDACEKRNLTTAIDRRNDRLRTYVKPVEATATRRGLSGRNDETQRRRRFARLVITFSSRRSMILNAADRFEPASTRGRLGVVSRFEHTGPQHQEPKTKDGCTGYREAKKRARQQWPDEWRAARGIRFRQFFTIPALSVATS
jgi:hypothetical protein